MACRRLIAAVAILIGCTLSAVATLRAGEPELVIPQPHSEPATPEEVFDPPQLPLTSGELPGTVKIDGADDGSSSSSTSPSESEVPEDDPFPAGFAIRWLMPVDGFGITDLELGSTDHRPRFSDKTRLNFDIPFAVHFIDEPQPLGLPSELYSAQIESRWVQPLDDLYGFDIAVTPGWFSDFDAGRNNGFRVSGHGMATMRVSETLQFALGAMYLGREDVRILPAGGVRWAITPDTRLDLLMPKPRISQRIRWHENDEKDERYIYAGFELFGGNSWAVTRPDDSYDTFTYRDFRFLVGFETRNPSITRSVLELGYVFARKLEFERSPETLHPGGTLLLRLGSAY